MSADTRMALHEIRKLAERLSRRSLHEVKLNVQVALKQELGKVRPSWLQICHRD